MYVVEVFQVASKKKSKLKISPKTLGTQNQRPKTRPINPFPPLSFLEPSEEISPWHSSHLPVFSAAAAQSATPPSSTPLVQLS